MSKQFKIIELVNKLEGAGLFLLSLMPTICFSSQAKMLYIYVRNIF